MKMLNPLVQQIKDVIEKNKQLFMAIILYQKILLRFYDV